MNQQSPMSNFAFPNEHMSGGFGVEQGNYPAETVRLTYIENAVQATIKAGEGIRRQYAVAQQTHAQLAEARDRQAQVNENTNRQRAHVKAIIAPQITQVTPIEKLDMMQAHAGNSLDLYNTQFDESRANEAYVSAVQGGILDGPAPASLDDERLFYEDLFAATESRRSYSDQPTPELEAASTTVSAAESHDDPALTPTLSPEDQRLAEIRAAVLQSYPIETYGQPQQYGAMDEYALGA